MVNAQVKGLRDKMRAVQEENASYRASNKASEFEACVQVRSNAKMLPQCCFHLHAALTRLGSLAAAQLSFVPSPGHSFLCAGAL